MTDSFVSQDIHESRRWGMLGVVHFCLFIAGMAMQTVPPLLTAIVTEFGLLYAEGGLLMGFFALPAIFIAIPAGMLADRYNQKTISIISLILIIAGTILFFNSTTVSLLIIGRIITGIGSAGLFVLAPQIVAQWFSKKELGLAIGILNTSIPLGAIIVLNLFSLISDKAGWRTCIYPGIGLPVIAIISILFFFTRATETGQHHKSSSNSMFREIRQTGLFIWLIAIAWMFYNMVISSLITFTPDYLQMNGFSILSAGFITSAFMWPSLVMSPAIGFIMDKIGHKHMIVISASLILCIMVAMIPNVTNWIIWLIILVGIVQSMISAPLFALASEVSEPHKQGVAFGIMATFQNIGSLLGPFIIGFIRDTTGTYRLSYFVMSGTLLIIIMLFIVLRKKQRQMT
jgi:MFS family permease